MTKKKILLVAMYDINTSALAPPILKAYSSQFEISQHFDIDTIDLSVFSQSQEEHLRIINSYKADVIGFSVFIWNVSQVFDLVKQLDQTIIVGGPQCSEVEEEILFNNTNIDIVVTGEGEETFTELLEYFAGKKELRTIKGVTSRKFKSAPRPVVADINTIPSPVAQMLKDKPDMEWISYETSRGCPFLCKYCTWGYDKSMRYYNVDRVLDELSLLLAQPKLKHIYLCDSSILYKKERARIILNHIIKNNPNGVTLRYEFDAVHLNDEIIDLLAQLPFNEFNFGVQSINPIARKTMKRHFRQEKFEENYYKMSNRIQNSGITMDLIYGLPGDNYEGYVNSMNYVLKFKDVKWILTNPLILLPGADFYREKEEHGITLKDKESYMVTSTKTFSKEDMHKALKLSFEVSVIMFNTKLRQAFYELSIMKKESFVDTIIAFFDQLPFPLIKSKDYPYMVPSIAKDFLARNLAVYRVVHIYPQIVEFFHHFTNHLFTELLSEFEDHYNDRHGRLKAFAEGDAVRHGFTPPTPPTNTKGKLLAPANNKKKAA